MPKSSEWVVPRERDWTFSKSVTSVIYSAFHKTSDGFRSSFEIRELKHRRFWATDVNRKSKLLLFDLYNSLFVENNKLISSSLRTWRFHSVVVNQILNGNFTPNFVGKLTSSLREKFAPFGEIVPEFPYALWSSRLGITSFKMSCKTLQLNFPTCHPTPT